MNKVVDDIRLLKNMLLLEKDINIQKVISVDYLLKHQFQFSNLDNAIYYFVTSVLPIVSGKKDYIESIFRLNLFVQEPLYSLLTLLPDIRKKLQSEHRSTNTPDFLVKQVRKYYCTFHKILIKNLIEKIPKQEKEIRKLLKEKHLLNETYKERKNTFSKGNFPSEIDTRIFLQTPFDRIKKLKNDYSDQESLFQQGLVKLVDLGDKTELYRKEKKSMYQVFLESEKNIKTLSIIIPVKGKKTILLENLSSILRQTFVKCHPKKVEILIIQDGYVQDKDENPICEELFEKIHLFPQEVKFRLFKLSENKGRPTARNVGIYHASHEIMFFIDSSMILECNFLSDHMIRHHYTPQIALLGFKENITLEKYTNKIKKIIAGDLIPNYCKDLKWIHPLKKEEANFLFKNHSYKTGDKINYMDLTNNFKNLTGIDAIGNRTLPTFFQTNIVSTSSNAVKQVGGFEEQFNSLWGFEDSYLGALLFAKGIKFIPCPSSVAFKIEHSEEKTKFFDIKRHGQLFNELLHKKNINEYCEKLLNQKISKLKNQSILQEIKINKKLIKNTITNIL